MDCVLAVSVLEKYLVSTRIVTKRPGKGFALRLLGVLFEIFVVIVAIGKGILVVVLVESHILETSIENRRRDQGLYVGPRSV